MKGIYRNNISEKYRVVWHCPNFGPDSYLIDPTPFNNNRTCEVANEFWGVEHSVDNEAITVENHEV